MDPATSTFVGLHDLGCPLQHLALQHCEAKLRELQATKSFHRPPTIRVDAGRQQEKEEKRGFVSRFVQSVKQSVQRPLAKTAARYMWPYGNVHMSLMVGPLMIENGLAG